MSKNINKIITETYPKTKRKQHINTNKTLTIQRYTQAKINYTIFALNKEINNIGKKRILHNTFNQWKYGDNNINTIAKINTYREIT